MCHPYSYLLELAQIIFSNVLFSSPLFLAAKLITLL